MVVLASSVASCEYKEGKYRVLSITIVVSGTPLPTATYLAVAFKLSRFVSVSPKFHRQLAPTSKCAPNLSPLFIKFSKTVQVLATAFVNLLSNFNNATDFS